MSTRPTNPRFFVHFVYPVYLCIAGGSKSAFFRGFSFHAGIRQTLRTRP